jgi:glutathione reductase (NADPH)
MARFTCPTAIKVAPDNGSLQGHCILIVTGAKPMKLNIPSEEYLITNDEFLELDELPDKMVFVGGASHLSLLK